MFFYGPELRCSVLYFPLTATFYFRFRSHHWEYEQRTEILRTVSVTETNEGAGYTVFSSILWFDRLPPSTKVYAYGNEEKTKPPRFWD